VETVITIKAWRRPGYFRQVIESLSRLPRIYDYKVVISLDNCDNTAITEEHARIVAEFFAPNTYQLFKPTQNVGCAGNTRLLFEHAFNIIGADRVYHLEDDTIVSHDYLAYMSWAMNEAEKDENIFAVCPFLRNANSNMVPAMSGVDSFKFAWFEGSGGWGCPKRTWKFIEDNGGMFGIDGQANRPDVVGQQWKDTIEMVYDRGSWVWPINQFFRKRSATKHLCITPYISRTNNIGAVNGRFNPNPHWHAENMHAKIWVNNYSGPITPYSLLDSTYQYLG
jgi:hypothetical protein